MGNAKHQDQATQPLEVVSIALNPLMKSRAAEKDVVLKLSDGRIYTGRQALLVGLVDELGGFVDAVALAGELGGIIKYLFMEENIPLISIAITQHKKAFTGNGRADKKEMLKTAIEKYGKVDNHNEADAISITELLVDQHGI